jgi:hypothetical protein
MGFIGFETLDKLWTTIRDLIPTNMIDKEFAEFSPKKFVLEHAPVILSRGPVSSMTGINFASSLEAGTIVDPSLQGMLPFISEVKNTIAPVFEYATNPTKDNLHKLIWNEIPYGSRGVLETGKFLGQDLPDAINTKSWYNSPSGVSQSPNNPGEGVYKRDQDDTNIRSAGFTSTKEALFKEAYYMNKENEKMLQSRQEDAMENMGSAIRNNEPGLAQKSIQKFIDMGGNPQSSAINQKLTKMIIDYSLDTENKLNYALQTNDYTAAMKYVRLRELLQQLNARYPKDTANYGPANAAR